MVLMKVLSQVSQQFRPTLSLHSSCKSLTDLGPAHLSSSSPPSQMEPHWPTCFEHSRLHCPRTSLFSLPVMLFPQILSWLIPSFYSDLNTKGFLSQWSSLTTPAKRVRYIRPHWPLYPFARLCFSSQHVLLHCVTHFFPPLSTPTNPRL